MPRPSSRTHAGLRFRVRPLLLRFLANALSLALTAIIVPHIFFAGDYRILSWLLISAVFGILNAFLKPLIQIVMLPLIFVSYGLVVVNSCLLYALAWVFPQRFHVEHLLWALVGGLVCGLLEGLFQNLLGLSPPILEGGPDAVSEEIARRKNKSLEARVLAAAGAAADERAAEAAPGGGADGPEGGRP
jgi:putative membrane protein